MRNTLFLLGLKIPSILESYGYRAKIRLFGSYDQIPKSFGRVGCSEYMLPSLQMIYGAPFVYHMWENTNTDVRVVKEGGLRSPGVKPHGFEPHSVYNTSLKIDVNTSTLGGGPV